MHEIRQERSIYADVYPCLRYVYALRGQSRSTVCAKLKEDTNKCQQTLTTTKISTPSESLWKSHPSDFHPGQHNV